MKHRYFKYLKRQKSNMVLSANWWNTNDPSIIRKWYVGRVL